MNEQPRESNPAGRKGGAAPPSRVPAERDPSREQAPILHPRIYVASLADYNNGVLHGVWLDAAREPAAIHADITAMLARSRQPGAEEFAIHDYEEFGAARIDENDSIELVSAIARGIAEHGAAFGAWADVADGDRDLLAQFTDHYRGHYNSLTAYAEELMSDLGYERMLDEALPDDLRRYVHIDYDGVANDLFLGGRINVYPADEGGVWLFDA